MAKSLFKAVLIVAGFSIITRFLGFIFRVYLGRELGAELLGVYQVATSVFMVLLVLVSSGLPLAVSKLTAKQTVVGTRNNEHSIATSALLIGLVISVIICLLVIIGQNAISHIFTDDRCMMILLTLLPAVIASAVYSAFRGSLWGRKDYFSVSFTELFEQILRIAFFVIIINLAYDTVDKSVIAGWSLSVACIGSAVLATIIYFKKGGRLSNPKGQFKYIMQSSIPITGVRAATSLIQPLIAVLFPAMLVLNGVSNENALALFGIIMGMTFPLLFLPSTLVGALSFTLIPELSSSIAGKQYDVVKTRVKSSLSFAIIVSAMFIPFYLGMGEWIGEFLFDNSLSGVFLSKASWIMIPLGLSNITSSVLNAFNLEMRSFINNVLGGIVLILFVVGLTGVMQSDALIYGFGLCMITTTVLNLIMIKKRTKFSLGLVKPTVLSLIFIVPCALLGKWFYPLLNFIFPSFVSLCLGAVICTGSFVVLCIIFNLIDFVWVFSKFPKMQKNFNKNTKKA